MIMGSTSTFRHIDLLKYSETLFDKIDKYEEENFNHKYMVTKFIPKVITLFQDGLKSYDEKNRGGNFIVGLKNKLFEVQGDYSVLEPTDGFCAVGCGEYVAMGSLQTTRDIEDLYEIEDLDIPKKIEMALTAAEKSSCGVQRPFRIINTMNSEEILIE